MGSYSLLTLAIMVGFMYLNTFATEVLVIPAGTLAVALGVAKLLDFCFSLFAGAIIEKVKIGKTGKNQSWLYLGRWILAVSIMAEVCNTSAAPLTRPCRSPVRILYGSELSDEHSADCLLWCFGPLLPAQTMANRNAMTINNDPGRVRLSPSSVPSFRLLLPYFLW